MINNIFKHLVLTTVSVSALSFGIQSAVLSATFVAEGENAPGELISTAAGLVDAQYDKIQGALSDTGDIHLYELQMNFSGSVKFDASSELNNDLSLFVFNQTGEGVNADFNSVNFDFKKDEIFYLGINASTRLPLNEEEDVLLNPEIGKVNEGTLVDWEGDENVYLPVIVPYEISLDIEQQQAAQTVPEPTTITGLLLGLGFAAYSRRLQK